jgi:hypothetical protein
MHGAKKMPARLTVTVFAAEAAILALSLALLYFIAVGSDSRQQMVLAAVAFLMTAGPLFVLVVRLVLPYRA